MTDPEGAAEAIVVKAGSGPWKLAAAGFGMALVGLAFSGNWELVGVLPAYALLVAGVRRTRREAVLVLRPDRLTFRIGASGWLPWSLIGPPRVDGRGWRTALVIPFVHLDQIAVTGEVTWLKQKPLTELRISTVMIDRSAEQLRDEIEAFRQRACSA